VIFVRKNTTCPKVWENVLFAEIKFNPPNGARREKMIPIFSTMFLIILCGFIGEMFGREVMFATALLLTFPNAIFAAWWWNR
jgi:hypothetical protein